MSRLGLILLAACVCSGHELLTLRNGFTVEVQSHLVRNGTVVAETDGGSVEFPESELAGVQQFRDVSPETAQTVPVPVHSDVHIDAEAILRAAAAAQGLNPELVHSVAKVESGLRTDAVSPKGAQGLMQLMPRTAAALDVAPSVPAENAKGGAAYLRQLLMQYHGDAALALAAYNAGPGAVARYGGIPPYPETRRYVLRVLNELAKEQRKK